MKFGAVLICFLYSVILPKSFQPNTPKCNLYDNSFGKARIRLYPY